jgi:hypothetical protein
MNRNLRTPFAAFPKVGMRQEQPGWHAMRWRNRQTFISVCVDLTGSGGKRRVDGENVSSRPPYCD